MTFNLRFLLSAASLLLWCGVVNGQQATTRDSAVVPQLVNYTGQALDAKGNAISGIAGITFAIYKDQHEGVPLWMETQNVTIDSNGNYTVQLGVASPNGLPLDLFSSGEARWLGVRINGGEEQPRVMLLSVPYALKAGDAATVGGLPPSAFVLAAPTASTNSISSGDVPSSSAPPATIGGGGTADYVPLWTPDGSTLGNSVLFQSGTGSSAKIGINTTTPTSMLDIKGGETVRGTLTLPATGSATATAGKNSQPEKITASSYNSSSKAAVGQSFQWQAEPTGNDTSTPSGTLNLLFGSGTNTPSETGLNIASNGIITFAPGQTFPGGGGTITGVTAGTDLTGGGTSGNVTLNVDTTKVPQLNTANTFTGNQTVNGNLTATGVVSASSYQIGSNLFAFGSNANGNAFLGFAGSATTTGPYDTGIGLAALASTTAGTLDTATGAYAMFFNTTGSNDTATGMQALYENTTGYNNTGDGTAALFYNASGTDDTGIGYQALFYNTASKNTAVGSQALYSNTTGADNTASGWHALYSNTAGFFNTATGYSALLNNTTGFDNTADGADALWNNTTGYQNTAVGWEALIDNSTGWDNTATGFNTMLNNLTGITNTADGMEALFNTNADGNTGVGYQALYSNVNGNYLTCIGWSCTGSADGLTNATAIGAFAKVGQSNALVLGGTGDHAVKVGIGTETPTNVLTIARGAGHPVSDSWETYSSRRWKTNIKNLPNALSKVEQLRGVSYDLKDSGKHEIGVIAEEVGTVVPEVVSYEANGKDASGVDYSRLTALLIEAIKQQQKQISAEQKQVAAQAEQIRKLRNKDRLLEGKLTQVQVLVGELRRVKGAYAQPVAPTLTASANQ